MYDNRKKRSPEKMISFVLIFTQRILAYSFGSSAVMQPNYTSLEEQFAI